MRKSIIAANWKEHKTNSECISFLEELKTKTSDINDREIIILPTSVALSDASKASQESNIQIGCQNVYYKESGAFTGQISSSLVKDFCSHILVGHSERRHVFNESNSDVNLKVKAILAAGLIPIICIGETLEQKKNNETNNILKEMIQSALEGINDISNVIFAYEPVWAISGGDSSIEPATSNDAQEVHLMVRSVLKEKYGDVADTIRILYGGSVKPANVEELMSMPDIDGALVGGASLEVASFEKIIKY